MTDIFTGEKLGRARSFSLDLELGETRVFRVSQ